MNETVANIILILFGAILIGRWIWLKKAKSRLEKDEPRDVRQLIEPAREIQQQYWTPSPDEKKHFLKKGIDELSWNESLRLLHLSCLEMLSDGAGKDQLMLEEKSENESSEAPPGDNRDLILRLITKLCSNTSPYKPRGVSVWQWKPDKPDKREPDTTGIFLNASLTHLGCIEVIRLDDEGQPVELSFISLDELHKAIFWDPGPFCYGEFEFIDGRPKERMLVPLQYGISWKTPKTFDQDGSFTRFICHIKSELQEFPLNIGVGHQDFIIKEADEFEVDQQDFPIEEVEQKGSLMLGLGSIFVLQVALDLDDPRFDQRCRVLKLSPGILRSSMKRKLRKVNG